MILNTPSKPNHSMMILGILPPPSSYYPFPAFKAILTWSYSLTKSLPSLETQQSEESSHCLFEMCRAARMFVR